MKQQKQNIKYTFVDPNNAKVVQNTIQNIIIEKILLSKRHHNVVY